MKSKDFSGINVDPNGDHLIDCFAEPGLLSKVSRLKMDLPLPDPRKKNGHVVYSKHPEAPVNVHISGGDGGVGGRAIPFNTPAVYVSCGV